MSGRASSMSRSSRRPLARGIGVLAGMLVLVLGLLGLSSLLDWPAKTAESVIEVAASREEVWNALAAFGAYGEWNPVIERVTVAGEPRRGAAAELVVERPGGATERLEWEMTVYAPPRKLEFQDSFLFPSLRDHEYQIVVRSLGPGRSLVIQRERVEGWLAPFAELDAIGEGLPLISAALQARVEATERQ